MAKRVKPILNIPTVSSLEEAGRHAGADSGRKRELSLLELGLKEDVDALKLKCAEASEPIKQDIEVLEQALVRFGESKKTELFTRRRSVSLNFGILGFRASSSVKPMKKTTWEQVLGFLTSAKDSALAACIRTKREVDREALRQLPQEKLAEVGCRLEQTDSFYYELAETELARSVRSGRRTMNTSTTGLVRAIQTGRRKARACPVRSTTPA